MPTHASARKSTIQMVEYLIDVLSDTYVLMVKTHGYHWNVTGEFFAQLHLLLEEQYNGLFKAADDIAERMRALDLPAPGSMAAFLDNTVVKETGGQALTAQAMLRDLLRSHEQVRERIAEARDFADEFGDKGTEDLLIQRLRDHDKMIWMLRAQTAKSV